MKINRKLKNKYPWPNVNWRRRCALVARAIPEGVSVLDIGGGFGNLFRFLKNCRYLSLDTDAWTDHTIKADFNKGQFPDMHPKFQIIVCQGILEYIDEPEKFLEKIKKYGDTMLLTYRTGRTDPKQKNGFSFEELKNIIKEAGWDIIFQRPVARMQRFFYCRKQ